MTERPRKKTIRIGNAGGYWGDDLSALKRQLTGGPLDYITIDFLAEITMSILQGQRKKNPELGYATDFVGQMEECLPLIVEKNVKVITNAGGVNPQALGKRIIEIAKKKNLKIKVGVITGDDIMETLDSLLSSGEKLANMETGEPLSTVRSKVTSANVYLGAEPVVKALEAGCQIIVSGRVTDTGITLAPMIYEFGWSMTDWDKIAAGVVAGHIIECGCQSSGGNLTDWKEIKAWHNMGYPIIEMSDSGEFVVTKHEKTGGLVSLKSVKEQLVYEMGDAANYITPDGIARFDSIQLKAAGINRVKVFGIKGKPATPFLKVSVSYEDGWKSSGTLLISGPETYRKGKIIADIFWNKVGHKFEETKTELIGSGSIWPSQLNSGESNEVFLRLSARDQDASKFDAFGKSLATVILSGPSGMAVTGGGRPKASSVIAYWPALLRREKVTSYVDTLSTDGIVEHVTIPPRMYSITSTGTEPEKKKSRKKVSYGKTVPTSLRALCYARSGDKGDTCNVGVLARSEAIYEWLCVYLTANRVKSFFKGICKGKVVRYELDNLMGLNFLLEETLGGGGTKSLMVDPQGKTLAQALLQMTVDAPKELLSKTSSTKSSRQNRVKPTKKAATSKSKTLVRR